MVRTRTRTGAAVFAASILMVAGCGGDDTSTEDASSKSGDVVTDQSEGAEDEDSSLVLAYRVTGPSGSVVEVNQAVHRTGGADDEIQELSRLHTLDGETEGDVFTHFIDRAELGVTVTEGGPVTVEGFRTRHDDDIAVEFDDLEIVEPLATVEVSADGPQTVSLP